MSTTEQTKAKERKAMMKEACKSMMSVIRMTWGNGFDALGEEMRRAIVCQRVLMVFTGRDEESTVSLAVLNE